MKKITIYYKQLAHFRPIRPAHSMSRRERENRPSRYLAQSEQPWRRNSCQMAEAHVAVTTDVIRFVRKNK